MQAPAPKIPTVVEIPPALVNPSLFSWNLVKECFNDSVAPISDTTLQQELCGSFPASQLNQKCVVSSKLPKISRICLPRVALVVRQRRWWDFPLETSGAKQHLWLSWTAWATMCKMTNYQKVLNVAFNPLFIIVASPFLGGPSSKYFDLLSTKSIIPWGVAPTFHNGWDFQFLLSPKYQKCLKYPNYKVVLCLALP